MQYNWDWAQNKSKQERAVREVRGDSDETGEIGTKEVTEEAVKKVYVRLLGRVINPKEVDGIPGVDGLHEEKVEKVAEETTRRRGRPSRA